jgi:hypothetical protein
VSDTLKEARQLYLFDDTKVIAKLDARLWHGSFNSRESSLQSVPRDLSRCPFSQTPNRQVIQVTGALQKTTTCAIMQ